MMQFPRELVLANESRYLVQSCSTNNILFVLGLDGWYQCWIWASCRITGVSFSMVKAFTHL